MLAVVAMIVFIVAAILGWVDKTISDPHLLAIGFVGLAFLAAHLAFRLWAPDGRRW
jgi:hypothetical protein